MKKLSYIFLAGMLLVSCRKDEIDVADGPSLNDLFGPFYLVEDFGVSQNQIDFTADGDLIFTAELSKNTEWIIDITGVQSGARRVITGSDRVLSSENAAWEGGANAFPAFALEDAYIEVTFPNEEGAAVLYDTITITGLKTDDGILISSFEDGVGTNWSNFNQSTVTGGIVCGNGEAAVGNCQYSFEGAVGWDWAIGSVMIQPDNGTFNLPASASNLYFNMAFKALENVGPENSFVQIWFDEDENGDGVFDELTEDRFLIDYWSTDTEWDLMSILYSELQFDIDGNQVVTNGNGLPEPSKLVSVNIFFLANPANGNSKALVDHLIFTTDNPYTP
jgi:hypothetical protein